MTVDRGSERLAKQIRTAEKVGAGRTPSEVVEVYVNCAACMSAPGPHYGLANRSCCFREVTRLGLVDWHTQSTMHHHHTVCGNRSDHWLGAGVAGRGLQSAVLLPLWR